MRIAEIPPVAYRAGELQAVTFIRGGEGWNFHQGPRFCEFPDGRLFMQWGVYDIQECSNDGAVLYSVSTDQGESWSRPELWMKAPNAVIAGGAMLQLEGGSRVLQFYSEAHFVGAQEDKRRKVVTRWADYGSTIRRPVYRISSDGGLSWGLPREIDASLIDEQRRSDYVYAHPYQVLRLSNGELLLTVSYLPERHRNPQHHHVAVLLSSDGGEQWVKQADITVNETRGAMEPWLVETEPGRLYGIIRNKSGFLYEIRGSDHGRRWEEPVKTALPTVESMPKLLPLAGGGLLLVWNNFGSPEQRPRYPLVAAVSRGEGKSWSEPRVLANEMGLNQLSNFDLWQLSDGRILLCLSHYRAQPPACSDLDMLTFDEKWLAG